MLHKHRNINRFNITTCTYDPTKNKCVTGNVFDIMTDNVIKRYGDAGREQLIKELTELHFDLYLEKKKVTRLTRLFGRIFHGLASYRNRASYVVGKKGNGGPMLGAYPFIPARPNFLFDALDELNMEGFIDKDQHSFLDCGSGFGNQMLTASSYFSTVHGVEMDRLPARLSKFIASDSMVVGDNILTFNNYEDYDFIYFFCPLCSEELETEFERRVHEQMKVGAILIPKLFRVNPEKEGKFAYLKMIESTPVFLKVSN